MVSTYLSYRMYAADMSKSLSRIAKDPIVSRDAQYYKENISKVKTVDDFVDNYRLFSFAMSAYGLEDMAYAKGFMKKVLTSDLSDSKSFVNKLTDERYREFAKAFSFGTSGKLTDATATQTSAQEDRTVAVYKEQNDRSVRMNETDSYYNIQIKYVTSVDKIIKNERLRDYALTAYGIDPTYISDATLQNILTSDTSDPDSFVNQLGDPRYIALADAYNFDADGNVALGNAQSTAQRTATNTLYLDTSETVYYKLNINSITSVDDLLDDTKLRSYLITAYGLSSDTTDATLTSILTSDTSDPDAYVNQVGDERFIALADAFNFDADGNVESGLDPQSDTQLSKTTQNYYRNTNEEIDVEADFYETYIDNITSVDHLLSTTKLLDFVLTSYGFDPAIVSKDAIKAALTSDLSDPDSYANQIGDDRFVALAEAFNFDTDGTIRDGYDVQSAEQKAETTSLYLTNAEEGTSVNVSVNTSYYQSHIDDVKSANELLRNSKLTAYIISAYDLDTDISTNTLRMALESDLSDPKSFVNRLGDEKLIAMVKDFNFDASGKETTERTVQSAKSIELITTAYSDVLGTSAGAKAKIEKETAYYNETIGDIKTLSELLADERLRNYIITAYELDAKTSIETLRKVLTSDITDEDSVANTMGENYREAASAFNFMTTGTIAREPASSPQTSKEILTTLDLYNRQTMELLAGNENEGVRLALYFSRKASGINSAYDILADKALAEVVRTTLGLPESFSQADIEVQARLIENKINIEDFQDQELVDKFVARFATLYDVDLTATSQLSAATTLFGNSENTGFSEDLMYSALTVGKLHS